MHDNTENMPDSIFLFVKSLGFPTKLNYIGRGHTVLKHFRLNCSPRILGVDSILNFDRSLFLGFGSSTKDGYVFGCGKLMQASAISPKKMISRLSFHKHLVQTKIGRNMRIQLQPQKTRTARSMMKKKTQAPAGTMRCKVV